VPSGPGLDSSFRWNDAYWLCHPSPMTSRKLLAALCVAGSLLLPAGADAQPSRDRSLRAFLQNQFRADREYYPDTRYVSAWADLNGDDRAEAIVYLLSGGHCGSGGCGVYVYRQMGRSWRRIAHMSVSNPPIRLLATRSRGWRDLGIRVRGGGIGRGYEARLSFDGARYPLNPTTPPAERLRRPVPGRVLISEEDRGRRLF
jgi:hypothetical protein